MVRRLACRRQSTSHKLFGALISVALLVSCTSAPKKEFPVGQREAQWHGNLSIKDKQTNKSNYLVMDALAREPDDLRLEITTQLGIPVASIVIEKDRMQALIPHEKKFIDAPATAQSLGHIAHMPIRPQVLIDLLFGNDLSESKGWTCDTAPQPSCTHAATKATVVWMKKDGDPRQFSIDSPRASGNFSIHELRTKVEFDNQTFKLTPPKNYKIERL